MGRPRTNKCPAEGCTFFGRSFKLTKRHYFKVHDGMESALPDDGRGADKFQGKGSGMIVGHDRSTRDADERSTSAGDCMPSSVRVKVQSDVGDDKVGKEASCSIPPGLGFAMPSYLEHEAGIDGQRVGSWSSRRTSPNHGESEWLEPICEPGGGSGQGDDDDIGDDCDAGSIEACDRGDHAGGGAGEVGEDDEFPVLARDPNAAVSSSQAGREDTQARYTLGDVSCTLSVKGNWTADEDEEDAAEADPEKVSASLMSLSVEDRFAVMSSIIRKSLDPTGDIVRVNICLAPSAEDDVDVDVDIGPSESAERRGKSSSLNSMSLFAPCSALFMGPSARGEPQAAHTNPVLRACLTLAYPSWESWEDSGTSAVAALKSTLEEPRSAFLMRNRAAAAGVLVKLMTYVSERKTTPEKIFRYQLYIAASQNLNQNAQEKRELARAFFAEAMKAQTRALTAHHKQSVSARQLIFRENEAAFYDHFWITVVWPTVMHACDCLTSREDSRLSTLEAAVAEAKYDIDAWVPRTYQGLEKPALEKVFADMMWSSYAELFRHEASPLHVLLTTPVEDVSPSVARQALLPTPPEPHRNGPRSQKLSELEARRSNAIAAHGSRNEDVSRRNRGGDNNSPSSSRDASGFVSCRGVNFGGGCVDSVSASSSFTSGARSCSSTVAGNHGSHEFDSSEGRYDARAISEIDQNGTVEGCSRGRAHRMGVASTIMTRNENNHHGNGEMGEDYHPRTLAESPAVSGSVPPAGDMYCRDERGRPIRKRKLSDAR